MKILPSLLQKLFPRRFGVDAISTTADRYFDDFPSHSTQAGERINADSANRISTYYACKQVISQDVGKLPLVLFRREANGNRTRATDHPLYRVLKLQPNPFMTSYIFRKTVQDYALSWGNGLAEIQRNGLGDVMALTPIHPNRIVDITVNERTGLLVYEIRNESESMTATKTVKVPGNRILHIRGAGDGIKGISVATFGRQSLGIAAAQQTFAASFFGNGATLRGLLQHPGELGDEARQRIRESFQALHGGAANAFKLAILEEGMEWKNTSMSMIDAQFLDSQHFSVEEVARWFRVAPHKVGHLLRATFDNIEAQNIDHVTDTLDPWLIQWEQEIETKLISPEEQGTIFPEFEVKALLKGDSKARGEFYSKLFSVGGLSPNEAAALENMDGIGPEGDTRYVPVNFVPVGTPVGNMAGATNGGTQAGLVRSPIRGLASEADGGIPPHEGLPFRQLEPTPEEMTAPFMRILKQQAEWLVRKEVSAAKRHAKKSAREFEAGMVNFYAGHRDHIIEALIPVTTSIYEVLKCTIGPAPFLGELADELCDSGYTALEKARDADVVDQTCESWNENKVHTITTRVMASALSLE